MKLKPPVPSNPLRSQPTLTAMLLLLLPLLCSSFAIQDTPPASPREQKPLSQPYDVHSFASTSPPATSPNDSPSHAASPSTPTFLRVRTGHSHIHLTFSPPHRSSFSSSQYGPPRSWTADDQPDSPRTPPPSSPPRSSSGSSPDLPSHPPDRSPSFSSLSSFRLSTTERPSSPPPLHLPSPHRPRSLNGWGASPPPEWSSLHAQVQVRTNAAYDADEASLSRSSSLARSPSRSFDGASSVSLRTATEALQDARQKQQQLLDTWLEERDRVVASMYTHMERILEQGKVAALKDRCEHWRNYAGSSSLEWYRPARHDFLHLVGSVFLATLKQTVERGKTTWLSTERAQLAVSLKGQLSLLQELTTAFTTFCKSSNLNTPGTTALYAFTTHLLGLLSSAETRLSTTATATPTSSTFRSLQQDLVVPLWKACDRLWDGPGETKRSPLQRGWAFVRGLGEWVLRWARVV